MRKKILLLAIIFLLAGCLGGGPSDDVLTTLIQDSMKRGIPIMVIGNMLGGELVSLEQIEIEEKEKEKWEPNSVGKMFGKKPYTYWDVTVVVKGTARLKPPVGIGELRGFHARHIWRVRKSEDGQWYVNVTDDFSQQQPKQPVDPHWWVIDVHKKQINAQTENAVENVNQKEIEQAPASVDQPNKILEQEYTLRIVARSGEFSGVWRVPDLNPNARNYYLIVEPVAADGTILQVPVLSEETGKQTMVSKWGLRVDENTFQRIAADKKDDGIIQNNTLGKKKKGFLEPDYTIPTSGGAITSW